MEVLGLMLGCLGAIGGVLWVRDQAKRRLTARAFGRAFWRVFDLDPAERVVVVVPTGGKCSDRDGPDLTPTPGPNIVTTVEDSMARSAIYGALISHGINPEVRLHNMLSDDERAEHLVLICGPAGNCVARDLLARTDVVHHYNFSRGNGSWSIRDSDRTVVHTYTDGSTLDYAIIAKYRNPWSKPARQRNIYLVAGLEGLGTWGAAYLLATKTDLLIRYLKAPGKINPSTCFGAVVSVHRAGEHPHVDDVRVHAG